MPQCSRMVLRKIVPSSLVIVLTQELKAKVRKLSHFEGDGFLLESNAKFGEPDDD